jgi:hypothetical protein
MMNRHVKKKCSHVGASQKRIKQTLLPFPPFHSQLIDVPASRVGLVVTKFVLVLDQFDAGRWIELSSLMNCPSPCINNMLYPRIHRADLPVDLMLFQSRLLFFASLNYVLLVHLR